MIRWDVVIGKDGGWWTEEWNEMEEDEVMKWDPYRVRRQWIG